MMFAFHITKRKLKGVVYILIFYQMMISLYIYLKVLSVMTRLPRPALIF
jgi:disulfide bond formation protein DsbB